jgi:hypothetical protein
MRFRVDDEELAMGISQKFCRLASRRIRGNKGREKSVVQLLMIVKTALVLYVQKSMLAVAP